VISNGEKKGDSQAAVCHRIQQTMAGGRKKEYIQYGESAKSEDPPKSHGITASPRQQQKEASGESAMAQKSP